LPSDMDVDAISKYELEAVDRASAELVLIRVLLCKLMVWDVSDGGVKAGEVSTHFGVRYGARPIQRNQVFLGCISLASISNKDIVKWLFVLQRQLVNAHMGNPRS